MASGTINKPYSDAITTVSMTYVENDIINANGFSRITCLKSGNLLAFYFNCGVTNSTTADFVKFGTVSVPPYQTMLFTVPLQGTSGGFVTFQIDTSGGMYIYKTTTASNLVRMAITAFSS